MNQNYLLGCNLNEIQQSKCPPSNGMISKDADMNDIDRT